jgi:hypothetical protein
LISLLNLITAVVRIKRVRFFLGQFDSANRKNYYNFVKLSEYSLFLDLVLKPYIKSIIYMGTYQRPSSGKLVFFSLCLQ